MTAAAPMTAARRHIGALVGALAALDAGLLDGWGQRLAVVLGRGGRLLVAGNGGSAAQAQHLTAEFTGRFAADRRPYSAIALHADTSAVTAIANDYGYQEVFARQVLGHGRPGDVLLSLSASGRSQNLLRAAAAARRLGLAAWALTGPAPNPLADACDEAVCVRCPGAAPALAATVQEAHGVALHLICLAFDGRVAAARDGTLDGAASR
ncbi:MAG TPA: SIS domain-containing protein [Streptosporangiaceae bacterium]|jgi:phosphoheptose isomerase|nr:SIS domain-containing protein [Streptosporangiaceae bacterium]